MCGLTLSFCRPAFENPLSRKRTMNHCNSTGGLRLTRLAVPFRRARVPTQHLVSMNLLRGVTGL
jgi:hypothetical protein